MEGVHAASGEVIAWTHVDLQTDLGDVFEAYDSFFNHHKYPNCILMVQIVGCNLLDGFFMFGMSVLSLIMLRV